MQGTQHHKRGDSYNALEFFPSLDSTNALSLLLGQIYPLLMKQHGHLVSMSWRKTVPNSGITKISVI